MFNLDQICQNSEGNLPSSTRSLFSDKARCFSQSECALYGNFIIKLNKAGFLWTITLYLPIDPYLKSNKTLANLEGIVLHSKAAQTT